eukprot:SAG11_NODE_2323_length_3523_cov_5.707652_5_plen_211_part_00
MSEPEPEDESGSEGFVDADDANTRVSAQLAGLEGLITRLVTTVEGQNQKLEDQKSAQEDLLRRLTALEAPAPAPAPAAAAVEAAVAAPLTALEARLAKLEQAAAKAKAADADIDPDDDSDYSRTTRGAVSTHQVRPNGVTDKPQLYPLKEGGDEVYRYLFSKKSAAYHEIGTLACALSYFWDCLLGTCSRVGRRSLRSAGMRTPRSLWRL